MSMHKIQRIMFLWTMFHEMLCSLWYLKHVCVLTCSLIYYVQKLKIQFCLISLQQEIRTCMGRSRGLPLFPWRAFSNLRPSLSISTVESCNSSRCCLKMGVAGTCFCTLDAVGKNLGIYGKETKLQKCILVPLGNVHISYRSGDPAMLMPPKK